MPVARIVQRGVILLASLAALLFGPAAAIAQTSGGGERTGSRTWWLPENVSTYGAQVDWLFDVILWMTLIVGALVFIVLIYFLIKYRYNPNRTAIYIHGNNKLEIVWTLVPALLMAATAAISQATWAYMKNPADWPKHSDMVELTKYGEKGKEQEVVHLEVVAQQFNWVFHYPGPDGKLGPRHAELIGPDGDPNIEIGLYLDENVFKFKTGETLYGRIIKGDKDSPQITVMLDGSKAERVINRSDLAGTEAWGADDFCTRIMAVPVNTKVFIELGSVDVLHSFFLPNMRVKQDAVPGLNVRVWFEATKLSEEVIGKVSEDNAVREQREFFEYSKPFEIVCAELCGANHSNMRGFLYVVNENNYRKWRDLEQKEAVARREPEF